MKLMKITSRHSQLTDVDTPHIAAGIEDGVLTPAKLLGYAAGMHGKPINVKSDGAEFEVGSLALIKTGQYTGDGSVSHAITGIGFTPKWIIIADPLQSDFFIKQTNSPSAQSIRLRLSSSISCTGFVNNFIISIDADGFTVDDSGADSPPNRAGNVYEYLCIG